MSYLASIKQTGKRAAINILHASSLAILLVGLWLGLDWVAGTLEKVEDYGFMGIVGAVAGIVALWDHDPEKTAWRKIGRSALMGVFLSLVSWMAWTIAVNVVSLEANLLLAADGGFLVETTSMMVLNPMLWVDGVMAAVLVMLAIYRPSFGTVRPQINGS